MAALSLLQNNAKQKEQAKQDQIAAAEGQAPAPKQAGEGNGLNSIMGLLKTFKTQNPQDTQLSGGLSKGTGNLLDSQGFDGKSAPSNEDLLSDY